MRLFEQFSYFNLAIIAARTAIDSIDPKDPEIVSLSMILYYFLALIPNFSYLISACVLVEYLQVLSRTWSS